MAAAAILAALPSDGVTTGAVATKGKNYVNLSMVLEAGTRLFRLYTLLGGKWQPHPSGNFTHSDGQPGYTVDAAVMSGRFSARAFTPGTTHALALTLDANDGDAIRIDPTDG